MYVSLICCRLCSVLICYELSILNRHIKCQVLIRTTNCWLSVLIVILFNYQLSIDPCSLFPMCFILFRSLLPLLLQRSLPIIWLIVFVLVVDVLLLPLVVAGRCCSCMKYTAMFLFSKRQTVSDHRLNHLQRYPCSPISLWHCNAASIS